MLKRLFPSGKESFNLYPWLFAGHFDWTEKRMFYCTQALSKQPENRSPWFHITLLADKRHMGEKRESWKKLSEMIYWKWKFYERNL